jgi:DNA-binding MarR family transcriptional regulator
MTHDGTRAPADGRLDAGPAELGLAVLLEAYERAVDELGSAIPPAQLRALLMIQRAGSVNLTTLAKTLGVSASATSRLVDRMQAAGLLTRDRAAASRREVVLLPTESGRRLAEWVRAQRRAVLEQTLLAMSPGGREALLRGLAELGVGPG